MKEEFNEQIRDMLQELPDKIMKKEREILDKSDTADKLELETKSTEISYERQIFNEMDGEKKKYKNELERKKELDLRLARNDIYKSNIKRLAEIRIELKEENIMLGYLKRRFRCAVSLSRLGE